MQHGDIGFYLDVFSLGFIGVIVGMTAIACLGWQSAPALRLSIVDLEYCAVAIVCAASFVVVGTNLMDYENAVLVTGGCVFYLILRQSFVKVASSSGEDFTSFVIALLIAYAAWQFLISRRMCAVFSNENYFAGFLAVAAPMLLGASLDCGEERMNRAIAYGIVAALSAALIAYLRGRSALIGVGAGLAVMLMPISILWWRKVGAWLPCTKALQCMLVAVIFLIVCPLAMPAARQIYLIKPISGAGRVLIWTVTARMAAQMPIAGVGFGNFADTYNLYQAEYFAHGGGSVVQRMAADPCRHAFNEPLEVAAELGLPGLLVFTVFCGLILKEVWEVVTSKGTSVAGASVRRCSVFGIQYSVKEEPRQEIPQPCRRWRHGADAARDDSGSIRDAEVAPTLGRDWLTLGMAGSVVCFMIMSLFHFPRKVVPTWLVFNYALACIVTVNQQCKQGVNELKRTQKNIVASTLCWRVFWFIAFVGSAALLPLYVKNYLDARRWIAAHELTMTGEFARACATYTELYPKLKWSGRFCAYYGNVVMAVSEKSNASARIDGRATRQAVALYEKAKYTYPDPYMFENLAVAYLKLMDGTNWPVVVQTRYHMETPAQVLMRKLREWRCGTNLFFEPPATQLTRGNCIGRAVDYLTLASNILPWRLTSKWYLAQVYRNVGNVSNAVKYAQLVVNIPMKKDTPQGRVFKHKAQNMLNDLGVPCDDPGMVVFDIHDRKTWNEGKW